MKRQWTKESYQRYLKTPHWRSVQKTMYGRYDACENCGLRSKLNIHHLSYARLGAELDTDLVVVCAYCHEDLHNGSLKVRVYKRKPSFANSIRRLLLTIQRRRNHTRNK